MSAGRTPTELRLDDYPLLIWATPQDRPGVSELVQPLETMGARLVISEPPPSDDQNGAHVFCWSSDWIGWQSELARLMKELHKRQQHFCLLDLDESVPEAVKLADRYLNTTQTPRARVQLKLVRFVLDGIERQWLAPIDDSTQMIPSALRLAYNGKEISVPPDFDGLVSVGRGASNRIRLDSSYVSRLHGCFRYTAGRFTYRDMSQNGSILIEGHEEQMLFNEEAALLGSGRIRIGDQTIEFSVAGPP